MVWGDRGECSKWGQRHGAKLCAGFVRVAHRCISGPCPLPPAPASFTWFGLVWTGVYTHPATPPTPQAALSGLAAPGSGGRGHCGPGARAQGGGAGAQVRRAGGKEQAYRCRAGGLGDASLRPCIPASARSRAMPLLLNAALTPRVPTLKPLLALRIFPCMQVGTGAVPGSLLNGLKLRPASLDLASPSCPPSRSCLPLCPPDRGGGAGRRAVRLPGPRPRSAVPQPTAAGGRHEGSGGGGGGSG